jgi:hypothetical protein
MNDCSRGDIRDVLPDLINDRLDPRTRADVEQHVAACADCAREVKLLRDLRGVLARTPAVDVARIAAAVRSAPTSSVASPLLSRTRLTGSRSTRLAAGIALVLGGATGLLLWNRAQDAARPDQVAVAPAPARPVDSVATPAVEPGPARPPETRPAPRAETPRLVANDGIVFGGGVADLAAADLEVLIGDLERLDVLTDVEPQPVLIDMEDGL